jgi:hypothetical protein
MNRHERRRATAIERTPKRPPPPKPFAPIVEKRTVSDWRDRDRIPAEFEARDTSERPQRRRDRRRVGCDHVTRTKREI